MEVIKFTEKNYDFKKALQRNIIKNIQPVLYSNKFVKYSKNMYVRELDGLAQFINFYVLSNKLDVWATYMPIFIPGDDDLTYAVQVTGSSGMDLLGKYYTHISSNTRGFGQEADLRHYNDVLVPRLGMLTLSIKEVLIPDMDQMNSFGRFVDELESPDAIFFGRRYDTSRGGTILDFFVAINMLFKEQFAEGTKVLKEIVEDMYAKGYKRDEMNDFSEKMVECLNCDLLQRKSNFQSFMDRASNEIRKEYKLIK